MGRSIPRMTRLTPRAGRRRRQTTERRPSDGARHLFLPWSWRWSCYSRNNAGVLAMKIPRCCACAGAYIGVFGILDNDSIFESLVCLWLFNISLERQQRLTIGAIWVLTVCQL